MRTLLNGLYRISGWLAACFIGAIGLLVVVQVGCNLIDRFSALITGTAIGLTIPSYADFTGFFLAAGSFLALAHTFREGGHIRVTLLLSHLPPAFARIIEFWCVGVAAAISCYFTWYTALLVWESFEFNDLSPGMIAIPLWIPQLGMLFGLVILSIALIDEIVCLVKGNDPSYQGKGENLLANDDESSQMSSTGRENSHA